MKNSKFSFLKIVVFLMFFLTVLTFFLILYIIPAMKKYKTNELTLKKYEKIYRSEKKVNNRLEKKILLLEKKYKKDIKRYNNNFDKEKFKKYAEKFINVINISKVEQKDDYIIYKLDCKINSINNLYKFIESLNTYANIVKITFPIVLEKEEKSYLVSLNVTIISNKLKKKL